MSFDPCTASGADLTVALRQGKITAASIVDAALARISATHAALNAFTTVTADRARAEAKAVDAKIAAGEDPGPLAGVPYGVKNLFDLAGVVTVAGSQINRDLPPATQDATAVQRLQTAGAICLGALNMGEYAYDFTTENTHDGACHNPHDLTRSAGGSSGGSGAAIAGGLVPLALGTDTNGSIRVPSSFCGTWGLKPTYGRLSRRGSFPFVDSLDHIGPLARSVADLANSFDVMQGPDSSDVACTPRPADPVAGRLDEGLDGLRLATLGGYFRQGGLPPVFAAVDRVAHALDVRRQIELPTPELARAAAFIISASEGGQLHLGRLRERAADFNPAIRERFLAGALTPAAWYVQAQKFRLHWREQLREIFRDVDVLIAPATPTPASAIGQDRMVLDGVEMQVRPNLGIFTQPISFIGLPVVAAPLQNVAGHLPTAVQLIAAPYQEINALRVARVLETMGVCTSIVPSF